MVVLSSLLHSASEVAEKEARASPIDVEANGLFLEDPDSLGQNPGRRRREQPSYHNITSGNTIKTVYGQWCW